MVVSGILGFLLAFSQKEGLIICILDSALIAPLLTEWGDADGLDAI